MKYKVLFADDNPNTLLGLKVQLKSHVDIEPTFVSEAALAIDLIKKDPQGYAAVVLDFHFEPEQTNGAEVATKLFQINKKLSIIICTGDSSTEPPIQSLKAKVNDFVAKEDTAGLIKAIRETFPYFDQLVRTFRLEDRRVKEQYRENEKLISKMGMIGRSDHLRDVCDTIEKIKNKPSNVLIQGESGTGKELVAQAIHKYSARSGNEFVAINCAAISPQLLESELFGHIKGAFSGAVTNKKGKFEVAHKGTIFLDEIGEMDIGLQAKLLRVLQERKITPVGGNKEIPIDVRVVAATNIDFPKAIAEGKFREDLYFRLSVIPINLLPLRDRKEDIPILIQKFQEMFGYGETSLKHKTFQLLENYNWPGNIRELKNVIERLNALSSSSVIEPDELHPKFHQKNEDSKLDRTVDYDCTYESFIRGLNEYTEELESKYILSSIRRLGSVRAASKHLNIPRTTLQRKLKSWGYESGASALEAVQC